MAVAWLQGQVRRSLMAAVDRADIKSGRAEPLSGKSSARDRALAVPAPWQGHGPARACTYIKSGHSD